jgi:hypothetical protein
MEKAPDERVIAGVKRDKFQSRWGQLKNERASWISHWKEISDNVLPRSGRFFLTDRNKGQRRHNQIYDNTGTKSLRILGAGLMSGATSPARPWFRLTIPDKDLASNAGVKNWLNDVTILILKVFDRSNTYRALHTMYEELGAFGTAASIIMPDYKSVIHHYPLTIGEYCIAANYQGTVDTLYRQYQKSVGATVKEFGLENCMQNTQQLFKNGQLDAWVTIIHAIEPRADRDVTKADAKNMPFASVHFEVGADPDKYLRVSGFKSFPAIVPRWAITGGDIYGNSPGMETLGDVKQLQHEQLRKAQCIDYQTMPPLQMPTSMKGREADTLPGGITYVEQASAGAAIQTAFNVNLNLGALLDDIRDVRERVRSGFYADLFMMLANQTDSRMTATEVAERHEEKLLMLGPVIERLHNECLDPLVNLTFERLLEADALPEIPKEMRGMNINVEFVSMLAQAQKAVSTNSIDRFVNNLGAVAQFKPEVLDKFDSDRWAEIYSDSLGIDPTLIVPKDRVEELRAQRAQAQQAQAKSEQLNQMADTAQKAAKAGGGGADGLQNVMSGLTGYNTAGA